MMNDRGLIDDGCKMFASFCPAVEEKVGGGGVGHAQFAKAGTLRSIIC
jgi:hypothetical protein